VECGRVRHALRRTGHTLLHVGVSVSIYCELGGEVTPRHREQTTSVIESLCVQRHQTEGSLSEEMRNGN
jgi:hypothetical protein